MAVYSLAEHVHACVSGPYLMLLDARQWEYFSYDTEEVLPIAPYVGGLPFRSSPPIDLTVTPDAKISKLIQEMRGQGWLTASDGADELRSSPLLLPTRALYGEDGIPPVRLPLERKHYRAFAAACIKARYRLRFSGLDRITRDCREAHEQRRDQSDTGTLFEANALTHQFYEMRPFAFTSKDHCLFNSLALGYFLRSFGVSAQWMFGVCPMPFAAHCWMQRGDIALNESLEGLFPYTPIMAINT